jgi:hypothetical protein
MFDGQRARNTVPDNLFGKVKVVPLDIICYTDYYFVSSAAVEIHMTLRQNLAVRSSNLD